MGTTTYRARAVLGRPDVDEARAQAYAGLGAHQWPYAGLSQLLDRTRRNGTPHQPKHCGCAACTNGFDHIGQAVVTR